MSGKQSARQVKSSDMQKRGQANLGQMDARLEKRKSFRTNQDGRKIAREKPKGKGSINYGIGCDAKIARIQTGRSYDAQKCSRHETNSV
jgi:hypothetical protein